MNNAIKNIKLKQAYLNKYMMKINKSVFIGFLVLFSAGYSKEAESAKINEKFGFIKEIYTSR